MSIKRILLPLLGSADHSGEIDTALSAAKALGAHVEALFISEPPPPTRVRMAAGDLAYGGGAAAAGSSTWHAEERDRLARDARERFTSVCAQKSIPVLAANGRPSALPAASWHESEGPYVDIAVARAAAFDLMVADGYAADGVRTRFAPRHDKWSARTRLSPLSAEPRPAPATPG